MSTYDFSTLYTTLPHNLINEKLTELIEQLFKRECSLNLACNDKRSFFTSEQPKIFQLWSCQNVLTLSVIFWTIYLCDLAQHCIDKLLVFLWVLIVLLLLQICFYFVMRETSCCDDLIETQL